MAVNNDPNVAANIARVGEVATGATGAAHRVSKPIPTSIGHYRTSFRFQIINAQAANSRLFEMRNPHASNIIIPTRLEIRWIQTGAHTAAIEDSLDFFKVTAFSAVDTTGTVTPTVSLKRGTFVATAALLRHVTIAGAAAGMTGGTLTKDGNAGGALPQWLLATQPTAGPASAVVKEFFDVENNTHPWAFVQNEGFIIENRVLLGAAAASSVYVDFSFAEVTAY